MNKMPGFNAVSSLSRPTRSYQGTFGSPTAIPSSVMPQALRNRVGGFGGGFGGQRLGFWCELGCAGAASLCIAATLGNPVGVAACIAAELSCLSSC